ncbi:hypothetical protein PR048_024220 [Dryococelus australis]|uniref:Uncharacterized protein n=1 Tax=Dryococelus australis TaxID=614101 RepID=A0ABQ9GN23_9NEOP|nr:hypothetical protein PR048_024220 [Dryococelus australis]
MNMSDSQRNCADIWRPQRRRTDGNKDGMQWRGKREHPDRTSRPVEPSSPWCEERHVPLCCGGRRALFTTVLSSLGEGRSYHHQVEPRGFRTPRENLPPVEPSSPWCEERHVPLCCGGRRALFTTVLSSLGEGRSYHHQVEPRGFITPRENLPPVEPSSPWCEERHVPLCCGGRRALFTTVLSSLGEGRSYHHQVEPRGFITPRENLPPVEPSSPWCEERHAKDGPTTIKSNHVVSEHPERTSGPVEPSSPWCEAKAMSHCEGRSYHHQVEPRGFITPRENLPPVEPSSPWCEERHVPLCCGGRRALFTTVLSSLGEGRSYHHQVEPRGFRTPRENLWASQWNSSPWCEESMSMCCGGRRPVYYGVVSLGGTVLPHQVEPRGFEHQREPPASGTQFAVCRKACPTVLRRRRPCLLRCCLTRRGRSTTIKSNHVVSEHQRELRSGTQFAVVRGTSYHHQVEPVVSEHPERTPASGTSSPWCEEGMSHCAAAAGGLVYYGVVSLARDGLPHQVEPRGFRTPERTRQWNPVRRGVKKGMSHCAAAAAGLVYYSNHVVSEHQREPPASGPSSPWCEGKACPLCCGGRRALLLRFVSLGEDGPTTIKSNPGFKHPERTPASGTQFAWCEESMSHCAAAAAALFTTVCLTRQDGPPHQSNTKHVPLCCGGRRLLYGVVSLGEDVLPPSSRTTWFQNTQENSRQWNPVAWCEEHVPLCCAAGALFLRCVSRRGRSYHIKSNHVFQNTRENSRQWNPVRRGVKKGMSRAAAQAGLVYYVLSSLGEDGPTTIKSNHVSDTRENSPVEPSSPGVRKHARTVLPHNRHCSNRETPQEPVRVCEKHVHFCGQGCSLFSLADVLHHQRTRFQTQRDLPPGTRPGGRSTPGQFDPGELAMDPPVWRSCPLCARQALFIRVSHRRAVYHHQVDRLNQRELAWNPVAWCEEASRAARQAVSVCLQARTDGPTTIKSNHVVSEHPERISRPVEPSSPWCEAKAMSHCAAVAGGPCFYGVVLTRRRTVLPPSSRTTWFQNTQREPPGQWNPVRRGVKKGMSHCVDGPTTIKSNHVVSEHPERTSRQWNPVRRGVMKGMDGPTTIKSNHVVSEHPERTSRPVEPVRRGCKKACPTCCGGGALFTRFVVTGETVLPPSSRTTWFLNTQREPRPVEPSSPWCEGQASHCAAAAGGPLFTTVTPERISRPVEPSFDRGVKESHVPLCCGGRRGLFTTVLSSLGRTVLPPSSSNHVVSGTPRENLPPVEPSSPGVKKGMSHCAAAAGGPCLLRLSSLGEDGPTTINRNHVVSEHPERTSGQWNPVRRGVKKGMRGTVLPPSSRTTWFQNTQENSGQWNPVRRGVSESHVHCAAAAGGPCLLRVVSLAKDGPTTIKSTTWFQNTQREPPASGTQFAVAGRSYHHQVEPRGFRTPRENLPPVNPVRRGVRKACPTVLRRQAGLVYYGVVFTGEGRSYHHQVEPRGFRTPKRTSRSGTSSPWCEERHVPRAAAAGPCLLRVSSLARTVHHHQSNHVFQNTRENLPPVEPARTVLPPSSRTTCFRTPERTSASEPSSRGVKKACPTVLRRRRPCYSVLSSLGEDGPTTIKSNHVFQNTQREPPPVNPVRRGVKKACPTVLRRQAGLVYYVCSLGEDGPTTIKSNHVVSEHPERTSRPVEPSSPCVKKACPTVLRRQAGLVYYEHPEEPPASEPSSPWCEESHDGPTPSSNHGFRTEELRSEPFAVCKKRPTVLRGSACLLVLSTSRTVLPPSVNHFAVCKKACPTVLRAGGLVYYGVVLTSEDVLPHQVEPRFQNPRENLPPVNPVRLVETVLPPSVEPRFRTPRRTSASGTQFAVCEESMSHCAAAAGGLFTTGCLTSRTVLPPSSRTTWFQNTQENLPPVEPSRRGVKKGMSHCEGRSYTIKRTTWFQNTQRELRQWNPVRRGVKKHVPLCCGGRRALFTTCCLTGEDGPPPSSRTTWFQNTQENSAVEPSSPWCEEACPTVLRGALFTTVLSHRQGRSTTIKSNHVVSNTQKNLPSGTQFAVVEERHVPLAARQAGLVTTNTRENLPPVEPSSPWCEESMSHCAAAAGGLVYYGVVSLARDGPTTISRTTWFQTPRENPRQWNPVRRGVKKACPTVLRRQAALLLRCCLTSEGRSYTIKSTTWFRTPERTPASEPSRCKKIHCSGAPCYYGAHRQTVHHHQSNHVVSEHPKNSRMEPSSPCVKRSQPTVLRRRRLVTTVCLTARTVHTISQPVFRTPKNSPSEPVAVQDGPTTIKSNHVVSEHPERTSRPVEPSSPWCEERHARDGPTTIKSNHVVSEHPERTSRQWNPVRRGVKKGMSHCAAAAGGPCFTTVLSFTRRGRSYHHQVEPRGFRTPRENLPASGTQFAVAGLVYYGVVLTRRRTVLPPSSRTTWFQNTQREPPGQWNPVRRGVKKGMSHCAAAAGGPCLLRCCPSLGEGRSYHHQVEPRGFRTPRENSRPVEPSSPWCEAKAMSHCAAAAGGPCLLRTPRENLPGQWNPVRRGVKKGMSHCAAAAGGLVYYGVVLTRRRTVLPPSSRTTWFQNTQREPPASGTQFAVARDGPTTIKSNHVVSEHPERTSRQWNPVRRGVKRKACPTVLRRQACLVYYGVVLTRRRTVLPPSSRTTWFQNTQREPPASGTQFAVARDGPTTIKSNHVVSEHPERTSRPVEPSSPWCEERHVPLCCGGRRALFTTVLSSLGEGRSYHHQVEPRGFRTPRENLPSVEPSSPWCEESHVPLCCGGSRALFTTVLSSLGEGQSYHHQVEPRGFRTPRENLPSVEPSSPWCEERHVPLCCGGRRALFTTNTQHFLSVRTPLCSMLIDCKLPYILLTYVCTERGVAVANIRRTLIREVVSSIRDPAILRDRHAATRQREVCIWKICELGEDTPFSSFPLSRARIPWRKGWKHSAVEGYHSHSTKFLHQDLLLEVVVKRWRQYQVPPPRLTPWRSVNTLETVPSYSTKTDSLAHKLFDGSPLHVQFDWLPQLKLWHRLSPRKESTRTEPVNQPLWAASLSSTPPPPTLVIIRDEQGVVHGGLVMSPALLFVDSTLPLYPSNLQNPPIFFLVVLENILLYRPGGEFSLTVMKTGAQFVNKSGSSRSLDRCYSSIYDSNMEACRFANDKAVCTRSVTIEKGEYSELCVGTPLANQRLVTYLPAGTASNRNPFVVRNSQSDTMPVTSNTLACRSSVGDLHNMSGLLVTDITSHENEFIIGQPVNFEYSASRKVLYNFPFAGFSCARGRNVNIDQKDGAGEFSTGVGWGTPWRDVYLWRLIADQHKASRDNLGDFEDWSEQFSIKGVCLDGLCHSIITDAGFDGDNIFLTAASMEQRWNARAGETGDLRENPPISGIVRHDSNVRKSRATRLGIELGSPWWEASSLTVQPSQPLRTRYYYIKRAFGTD